jgi:hypothetical protein
MPAPAGPATAEVTGFRSARFEMTDAQVRAAIEKDFRMRPDEIRSNVNPKFGSAGRCGGMQIMGKQAVYRSRLGFHGTDVVVYEYISDWGERAGATVIIAVR